MGQILLDPPSVFGWDWEAGWISSATLLARYSFARDLVGSATAAARFQPEKLLDLTLTDRRRHRRRRDRRSSASPTN